ncbi:MAG TPA: glycosyltransferase family 4 protein [Bacilli bacterium]|nr:glycosyltransferase family 4 protein [Bacilli bacterium]
MHIAFLLMYHHPERVSSYYLYDDLMEHLRNDGHIISVITPNPVRGLTIEDRKKYKNIKEELEYKNQTIHRVNVPFDTNSGMLRRALRYVMLSIKCSNMIKKIKPDKVYVQSDPPILYALLVSRVCKKLGIPTLYHIQDLAPDNITSLKKRSMVYQVLNHYHTKAMKTVNKIIVISEDLKDMLESKGIDPSKIRVVYNWKFDDVTCYDLIKHPMIEDQSFKVSYIGNIGYVQNMDVIMGAAKLLVDEDIHIHIIGDGIRKPEVIQMIEEQKLNNMFVHDKVAIEEVDTLYQATDINLITLNQGIVFTALPSKTSACIDALKPIIACVDKHSKYAHFIEQSRIGLVVDSNDASGLANAILKIKNKEISFDKASFEVASSLFSKQTNVESITNILKQME